MTKYWIGTVSADHVARGVAGGFAQVGHGKGAPLRRMSKGDWMIYYSPKTSMTDGEPLQAFTAFGEVADDEVYQGEMSADFHPWRRDIDWLPAIHAPIRPLLPDLDFTAGMANWGMIFRRGHFEIAEADARAIATAMGVELPD